MNIKKIATQFALYTVTLDYKGLVLLMAKINDEDFQLGGQGLARILHFLLGMESKFFECTVHFEMSKYKNVPVELF